VRDAQQRRPGDEGYDKRTLYVPDKDLKGMTDFERQYWGIKKDYFDVVIFFKKARPPPSAACSTTACPHLFHI
jgi:DNA mismatch repair protein MSH6